MILHVNSAEHREDYRIRVEFDDGVTKDVDLKDVLEGPVFEPLRDPEFFRRFLVNPETRTIEWPNGADLAPEFLYEIGSEVERVA